MAITITYLPEPTDVSAALQSGGSLLPNTTYYAVVTGKNFNNTNHYYPMLNGEMMSEASEEISFTTTDTQKSAIITWTKGTGSICHNVYLTKTSGDYSDTVNGYTVNGGKRCGASETADTCGNVSTYTIIAEGTFNTAYTCDTIGWGAVYAPNTPDKIMGVMPIRNRTVNVSFTGTVTLKQICNALDASGLSDYYFYNNENYFVLHGSIYNPVTQTTAAALYISYHTLIFFNGVIKNDSLQTTINLGYLTGSRPYAGNIIGCTYFDAKNMNVYNTIVDANILPNYSYHINGIQRRYIYNISSSNSKGNFFKDYGNLIGDYSNNYLISPEISYFMITMNTTPSGTVEWLNTYIDVITFWSNAGYSKFRDCTINLYSSSYMIGNLSDGDKYKFYDCTFGGLYTNDYSGHKYSWGTTAANTIIKYYNSVKYNVTDKEGNPIEGATVTMLDKDASMVLNTITDSSGNTEKYDILVHTGAHEYGQPIGTVYTVHNEYNPFTLTILKEGYEDYVLIFSHNKKLDTKISLNATTPPIYYQQQIDGSISAPNLSGSVSQVILNGSIEIPVLEGAVNKNNLQGTISSSPLTGDIY